MIHEFFGLCPRASEIFRAAYGYCRSVAGYHQKPSIVCLDYRIFIERRVGIVCFSAKLKAFARRRKKRIHSCIQAQEND